MALGPGIPQPPPSLPVPLQVHRHRLPEHLRVVARPILGGLHHDYRLEERRRDKTQTLLVTSVGGEDMARAKRSTTRVVYQIKVTLNLLYLLF